MSQNLYIFHKTLEKNDFSESRNKYKMSQI